MDQKKGGAVRAVGPQGDIDLGVRDHVVELEHEGGYRFLARFVSEDGEVRMNEPEPLGPGGNPEGVSLLAAAAAYGLSASLVFALKKVRVEPRSMRTTSRAHIVRTEERYRRVSGLEVDITADLAEQDRGAFERVVGRFPDFCIVTESIRGNFPIKVRVHHPWGVFEHVLPVRS
jgi:organic hydroperoxide reductase OsmC/OhrA